MTKQNYLKLLVEDIHSTTIATIGADGHPQTRVIDMMLYDEQGVYFLTAKGKAFYAQLIPYRAAYFKITSSNGVYKWIVQVKDIKNPILSFIQQKTDWLK